MKKNWIFYLLPILLFAHCKKPGCFENAGPVVIVKRTASPFHRIELFDNVNVILTQDSIESIQVKAPRNIEPNISTGIVNEILTIRNNASCKWLRDPSEKINVLISIKDLKHFEYAGSGNVTSANTILADNITFYSAEGAGNIDISLQVKNLSAIVEYESADFIFRGTADLCYCYANARGTLDFKNFKVKNLVIGYAGVRDVTVNASETIEATIYHTGNVYYKGDPPIILTSFYSSGRLFHIQ